MIIPYDYSITSVFDAGAPPLTPARQPKMIPQRSAPSPPQANGAAGRAGDHLDPTNVFSFGGKRMVIHKVKAEPDTTTKQNHPAARPAALCREDYVGKIMTLTIQDGCPDGERAEAKARKLQSPGDCVSRSTADIALQIMRHRIS
jgi:hypothetical protein